ncbi:MAG TPA: LuxR C-terminal-related transcriptional regulator [Ktedonosporobacter sp.]|nr:LuxR C-terminal-related transcriptional regulator [Ktedonosporobacter sp.]
MTQMRIPQVIDDCLLLAKGASVRTSIPVGSQNWYTWLADAQNRSFSFKHQRGTFTARHECQRNSWYWYAYQKQNGKICKAYLGRAAELNLERLNNVATSLAEKRNAASVYPQGMTSGPQVIPVGRREVILESGPLYQERILTAKLVLPPLADNLLPRPRLIERVIQGLQERLTLISAPAGWGKTTLMRQCCNDPIMRNLPVAWLSLSASDNDPVTFWSYVTAALDRARPGLTAALLPIFFTAPSAIEHALQRLLAALSRLSTPIVVMLDNYHVITEQSIHQSMSAFINQMPSQVRIILAGRLEPPLPLARLRAQRHLTELHSADLRFSEQEIADVIKQLAGITLSSQECATIAEQSGGWITALQLASTERHSAQALLEAITRPHRYIMDYVIEEIVLAQPEEIQQVLLQTSILDRLTPTLCDTVCERTDSQAILAYLERQAMLIVAVDEQRQWFRYHPIFAAALRVYASQKYALAELSMRASSWYKNNGIFTDRERDVLQWLFQGASNREIADRLTISEGTVKKHVSNICNKLGVRSRTQAIARLSFSW